MMSSSIPLKTCLLQSSLSQASSWSTIALLSMPRLSSLPSISLCVPPTSACVLQWLVRVLRSWLELLPVTEASSETNLGSRPLQGCQ